MPTRRRAPLGPSPLASSSTAPTPSPSNSPTPSPSISVGPEEAIFQPSPDPNSPLVKHWEPGCQPDEVYDRVLPPWRATLRRWLVKRLRDEADWMADWQKHVKSVRRDTYFYSTAVFGTHFFFMAFLPTFWFFGHPDKGRGMLMVVGLGIYVSSFAKDLVCTPRPYSPPVIRLSMSTHHQEYGFPSSHSTNAVSIALFFAEWLYRDRHQVGLGWMLAGWAVLTYYASSVIGGRLYTGMHSIADVQAGFLMGIGCWLFWFLGGETMESWVLSGSTMFPIIFGTITMCMIHYHPEPVDPCPCFEDAIAVLAVILGIGMWAWWDAIHPIYPRSDILRTVWERGNVTGAIIVVYRNVLGIAAIVVWRLLAKAVLLSILPPTFRLFAGVFDVELPTRKGYKPATSYNKVPATPLRPIPSMVHLPSEATSVDVSPEASIQASPLLQPQRFANGNGNGRLSPLSIPDPDPSVKIPSPDEMRSERKKKRHERIKYDAEVLTKVGVYAGIGIIATQYMPRVFAIIEEWVFR